MLHANAAGPALRRAPSVKLSANTSEAEVSEAGRQVQFVAGKDTDYDAATVLQEAVRDAKTDAVVFKALHEATHHPDLQWENTAVMRQLRSLM